MAVWLGLDIGGANLKAADARDWCKSVPFPLWREPNRLAAAVEELIRSGPAHQGVAVTMTGELADCYATKADGVAAILTATQQALTALDDRAPLRVYTTAGRFVEIEVAREQPLSVAAANWHALARFACRFISADAALLLDLGSTTCDLIPLVERRVAARGRTDPERLAYGELVYTGVVRSPVCALLRELPWRGGMCPVAQEVFSTTRDAYLLLEELPECDDLSTADGRPATRPCARDRLARQICADRTMFAASDALAAAQSVKQAQLTLLTDALSHLRATIGPGLSQVIVSGQGEFLLRRLVARELPQVDVISLTARLGPQASAAAAAHALAVLAAEAFS